MLTLESILRTTRQMAAFGEVRVPVPRDSDGTRSAACEDMPVPQDCQARAEGIAKEQGR